MIKIAPSIGSNGIGIITERRFSNVDHLVPLCQLMGIPLLVTERLMYEIIDLYYPPMELILYDSADHCLDEVLKNYDYFVYTEVSRQPGGGFQFFHHYTNIDVRSIFTHHGNSEKAFDMYCFERLWDEDVLLIYGDQMRRRMHEIGMTKKSVTCGNYRLFYYQQHKEFFQKRISHLLFPDQKRVLYAPTWADSNLFPEWRFDHSTCLETHQWVLDNILDGYQVFVKLHPNQLLKMPDESEKLIAAYQGHPQVCFINDLPLIYPLLEWMDIYVGDFSSIGYDFLYFNRPMFFLSGGKKRELHRCGIDLQENELWKRIDEDQSHLSPIRKKLYHHAFGEGICTLIS